MKESPKVLIPRWYSSYMCSADASASISRVHEQAECELAMQCLIQIMLPHLQLTLISATEQRTGR